MSRKSLLTHGWRHRATYQLGQFERLSVRSRYIWSLIKKWREQWRTIGVPIPTQTFLARRPCCSSDDGDGRLRLSSHLPHCLTIMTMTPDEESGAAVAPATATSPNDSAATESSSPPSPKGFIAVLTGAAKHLATSIRGPGPGVAADATMSQATEDDDATMDIEELDAQPGQSESFPSPLHESGRDVVETPAPAAIDVLDSMIIEPSTTTTLSLETKTEPPMGEGNSPKYVVDNGEEILVWDESIVESAHSDEKQVEHTKDSDGKLAEARLGEELENSLRSLQKVSTGYLYLNNYFVRRRRIQSVDAIKHANSTPC